MDISDKIETVVTWIQAAKNIVAFTGAGISTHSGIPDFRSPESGMWEKVDPFTVASIYGFRQNPQAFYDWVRPLARLSLKAQPNAAHDALGALERAGKLKAIITQNIDMLHSKTGHQTIYEIHGHMRSLTCITCYETVASQTYLLRLMEESYVPKCPGCGGVMKPDVVLFGEQLPIKQLLGAQQAARDSDLMIVLGSSLEVAPASEIPLLAARSGAKIVMINLEQTDYDRMAHLVIQADVADVMPAIVQKLEQRV